MAGIHICACESPSTTIVLVAEASPRWQRSLVVWLSVSGTQPDGNAYASLSKSETGGVSTAGTFAPRNAALTAATTAGSGALFGVAVTRETLAGVSLATAALA